MGWIMSLFKRRRPGERGGTPEVTAPAQVSDKKETKTFKLNFQDYIGQTVTIYVNSGGMAGKGFTGVLMQKTETYARLLIIPAVPPACALGSSCSGRRVNPLFCTLCPYNRITGAIAEIPIAAITAFVHNAF
jgi:hypothetical protein